MFGSSLERVSRREVQMFESPRPIRLSERVFGGALVAVVVWLQFQLMGPATGLLSLGLVGAFGLWAAGRWKQDAAAVLPVYLLGICVQCLHFCDEYVTGFQREFPGLLGYQWSDERFVTFNLIWLSMFVLAALGVLWRVSLAYVVVLFFAILGGIGNGIGHLGLCVIRGRYFPGAFTAPATLAVGVVLLGRLLKRA